MLSNKERSALRSAAHGLTAIFSVGKSGVTPELVSAVADALASRELIKIQILKTSPDEPAEASETLAGRTRSEVVCVTGRKAVLFKKNPEKSKFS